MSLVVDLAVLAEGFAADSRGTITLVGVNPSLLLTETFPVQFNPVLLVVLKNDEGTETLKPGQMVAATIKATGPDDETLFVFPGLRQTIASSPYPGLRPKVNVVSPAPFTASKNGIYTVAAHITVIDSNSGKEIGAVDAERTVTVRDMASLRSGDS
jgi:hypothetical protein